MTEAEQLVAVFEMLNKGHRRQVVWLVDELRRWEQRYDYPPDPPVGRRDPSAS